MRVVLIDTSGSLPQDMVERIRSRIQVGDHVLMFDTQVYDAGVMRSKDQIDSFPLWGGGGTSLIPALEKVRSLNPSETICFTDGYIFDAHQCDFSGIGFHAFILGVNKSFALETEQKVSYII